MVAPEKLNLLDVVEAIMGELSLKDCILSSKPCDRQITCAVHAVWREANNQLRQTLREATFDKLVRKESIRCYSMTASTC